MKLAVGVEVIEMARFHCARCMITLGKPSNVFKKGERYRCAACATEMGWIVP